MSVLRYQPVGESVAQKCKKFWSLKIASYAPFKILRRCYSAYSAISSLLGIYLYSQNTIENEPFCKVNETCLAWV